MSDPILPDRFELWAADDDFDELETPTKVALSDAETAQGFVPATPSIAAQEANWYQHQLSRGVRSIRDFPFYPLRVWNTVKDSESSRLHLFSVGGGIVYAAGDDGGTGGDWEIFDSFGSVVNTFGEDAMPYRLDDRWFIALYGNGTNMYSALIDGCASTFWSALTPIDPTILCAQTAAIDSALLVVASFRVNANSSYALVAFDAEGGDTLSYCRQLGGAQICDALTPPAAIPGATAWESTAVMWSDADTAIALCRGDDATDKYLKVNVYTWSTDTWSGWSTIDDADVAGVRWLHVSYSEALHGWVAVNNLGNIYLCDADDSPAAGGNWIQQNTGDPEDKALSFVTSFISATVLGSTVLLTTAINGSNFLLATDDNYDTLRALHGIQQVTDGGNFLLYYMTGNRIGISAPLRPLNLLDLGL